MVIKLTSQEYRLKLRTPFGLDSDSSVPAYRYNVQFLRDRVGYRPTDSSTLRSLYTVPCLGSSSSLLVLDRLTEFYVAKSGMPDSILFETFRESSPMSIPTTPVRSAKDVFG